MKKAKNLSIELKNRISELTGIQIVITVRKERKFTCWFEGSDSKAVEKIKNFLEFEGYREIKVDLAEDEDDLTCIYFEILKLKIPPPSVFPVSKCK